MSLQYSVTLRNNQLSQLPTTVGASPLLRLYTGAPPANCAAAEAGTKLLELTLPSTWTAAASGGTIAKAGTWTGAGLASGTAGYFRLYDAAGTTCHMQGTVTATGGGGDMTMDNPSIAPGQNETVNTFSVSAGNA